MIFKIVTEFQFARPNQMQMVASVDISAAISTAISVDSRPTVDRLSTDIALDTRPTDDRLSPQLSVDCRPICSDQLLVN